jgi:hypothetical protein
VDVKTSRRPEKQKRKMRVTMMKNYHKWFSSLFIRQRRGKKGKEERNSS